MNKEQIEKLKALAQAATPGPWITWPTTACNGEYTGLDIMTHDGGALVTEETHPSDDDALFIAAANPAAILELIALAEHSLSAQDEVLTDDQIDEITKSYFGKFLVYGDFRRFARSILSYAGHAMDATQERIALLEQQREELGQEVRDLITALAFWMPKIEGNEGPLAERVFKDCFLLAGIDGNLPDDFKTAQELGWIAAAPSPAVAARPANCAYPECSCSWVKSQGLVCEAAPSLAVRDGVEVRPQDVIDAAMREKP